MKVLRLDSAEGPRLGRIAYMSELKENQVLTKSLNLAASVLSREGKETMLEVCTSVTSSRKLVRGPQLCWRGKLGLQN